jgi:site-specific DNA-cytosine methylase
MKRKGNLYEQIYSIDNLMLADSIARKGKLKQPGIIEHDRYREYIVLGSQKNQVKQLGNAVTPPVMQWLVEKGIESLS